MKIRQKEQNNGAKDACNAGNVIKNDKDEEKATNTSNESSIKKCVIFRA